MSNNQHASFFKSENGDRIYDVSAIRSYFSNFFTNGISNNGGFKVTAENGMVVKISKESEEYNLGKEYWAHIFGAVKTYSTDQFLNVPAAHSKYDRYDNVVVEYNEDARDIKLKIVKGVPSVFPVEPAIMQSSNVFQLVIATLLIQKGSQRITMVIDKRGDETRCPFISSKVKISPEFEPSMVPDYDDTFERILAADRSAFDAWFVSERSALTPEQISDITSRLVTDQSKISTLSHAITDADSSLTSSEIQLEEARGSGSGGGSGNMKGRMTEGMTNVGFIFNGTAGIRPENIAFIMFMGETYYDRDNYSENVDIGYVSEIVNDDYIKIVIPSNSVRLSATKYSSGSYRINHGIDCTTSIITAIRDGLSDNFRIYSIESTFGSSETQLANNTSTPDRFDVRYETSEIQYTDSGTRLYLSAIVVTA